MEWQKSLEELARESRNLSSVRLAALSDLAAQDLARLQELWQGIPVGRRRKVLARLTELAEDNLELNFDAIFRHSLDDPDAEVRVLAIEGLAESEEPSLVDALLWRLQNDDAVKVRAAAAQALGRFALLAELNKLRPHYARRIEKGLLDILSDSGQPLEVRRRGLEAIAPFNQPGVTQLIHDAYHSQESGIRVSALYAMGRNCDPRWLPILIRELSSPDPEMRYEATIACGEMGEAEAVPHLAGVLRDDDAQVQEAAIQSLGKIGGNEARRLLHRLLASDELRLAAAAREALEEAEVAEDPFSSL